jgi:hypothetical protein
MDTLRSLRFGIGGSIVCFVNYKKIVTKHWECCPYWRPWEVIKLVSSSLCRMVAAHDRKWHTRAPESGEFYHFWEYYTDTQYSVLSIRSYHYLKTVQKTISVQNRV